MIKDRSGAAWREHAQRRANVQQISTSAYGWFCLVFFFKSALPGWALPARFFFFWSVCFRTITFRQSCAIKLSKQIPPEDGFRETALKNAGLFLSCEHSCAHIRKCESVEGDRCLLPAALLQRTSLLLFIHNLSSSSTSIPSSTPPILHIRAPVSFSVTVALTIRSGSGLFKAFRTQCLDFLLWPTYMGRQWRCAKKANLWRPRRENVP